ncbi:MAG TPA: cobalamin-binding protein [Candidatus Dormibacteraeota bacterium]|nr:cobalamin-binding protein [Candidatus Dormibacteraeota bacterium]
MRIASLLPSATEILCALGLADRVVGVSHECDFPPEIVGRPVLTAPKIDPRGTSAQIDAAVRRLVGDGLSVYRIEEAALRAARPDLIVTQDQCEVCAVSFAEVERAARALLETPARIISLRPNRLDEVLDDFARVASAAGVADAGARLVAASRARLDRIRRAVAPARSRPRVACIEWIEPLMIAGNWVPELVALGGGSDPITAAGGQSAAITWDALVASAPDVVIVAPCGFALSQTRAELSLLIARPEWQALPAVRNGRAYMIDGNAYLNRPGPRLVDSAELVAGLIQPGFCASLMPASGWEHIAVNRQPSADS